MDPAEIEQRLLRAESNANAALRKVESITREAVGENGLSVAWPIISGDLTSARGQEEAGNESVTIIYNGGKATMTFKGTIT